MSSNPLEPNPRPIPDTSIHPRTIRYGHETVEVMRIVIANRDDAGDCRYELTIQEAEDLITDLQAQVQFLRDSLQSSVELTPLPIKR